jgi:hypothetical protein
MLWMERQGDFYFCYDRISIRSKEQTAYPSSSFGEQTHFESSAEPLGFGDKRWDRYNLTLEKCTDSGCFPQLISDCSCTAGAVSCGFIDVFQPVFSSVLVDSLSLSLLDCNLSIESVLRTNTRVT